MILIVNFCMITFDFSFKFVFANLIRFLIYGVDFYNILIFKAKFKSNKYIFIQKFKKYYIILK